MPLVQLTLIEGRDPERISRLHREVTDAVARTTGADPQAVRVIVYEVPATHWAVAGEAKRAKEGNRGD